MRVRIRVLVAVLGVLAFAMSSSAAWAGCGCSKPPPPVADIRPPFASPGDTVTVFPDSVVEGATYAVAFKSTESGPNSTWVAVTGTAESRRDYADGVYKLQVVVSAPELPPGPTKVRVVDASGDILLAVSKNQFTMLQRPIALGQNDGVTTATCYRAAVGTDGTLYIPLDISAISDRMYFSGIGMDYPFLFGPEDVTIYNTQGILMQLLDPNRQDIYAILDPLGQPHSFELLYDRHEFNTYRQMHVQDPGYAHDPTDPEWHMNGTRHIDHDHLVLAIRGVLENQGDPAPGVTPPFDLDLATALAEGTTPVSSTVIQWSEECLAGTSAPPAPPAAP